VRQQAPQSRGDQAEHDRDGRRRQVVIPERFGVKRQQRRCAAQRDQLVGGGAQQQQGKDWTTVLPVPQHDSRNDKRQANHHRKTLRPGYQPRPLHQGIPADHERTQHQAGQADRPQLRQGIELLQ